MSENVKIHVLEGSRRHDIVNLLGATSDLKGIELGVASGGFSKRMIDSGRFSAFWGVDLYADHHDTREYISALQAVGIESPYKLLRMSFDEALHVFPDEYFDFVYIDGYAHTGENSGWTLHRWFKKVRMGGVIAGDDFHADWPLVVKAVTDFSEQHGGEIYVTDTVEASDFNGHTSWGLIKSDRLETSPSTIPRTELLKSSLLHQARRFSRRLTLAIRRWLRIHVDIRASPIGWMAKKANCVSPYHIFSLVNGHESRLVQKPWLVIGKGPSAPLAQEPQYHDCISIGLNDVVCHQSVDIAHFIDLDAVERCATELLSHPGLLLIPEHPQITSRTPILRRARRHPGTHQIELLVQENPVLKRFSDEERLLTYVLETDPYAHDYPPSQRARVGGFSAASVIDLAGRLGVQKIFTAGVDGGRGYSDSFHNLLSITHLDSGQASYDKQFESMAETRRTTNVSIQPLGLKAPIRIFLKDSKQHKLAYHVAAESLDRHCSMDCEIDEFSELASAEAVDEAIILDAKIINFCDVRELWRLFLQSTMSHSSQIKPGSVADTTRLTDKAPEDALNRPHFATISGMGTHGVVEFDADGHKEPPRWRAYEQYRLGHTALLHYSSRSAPWIWTENPRGVYWCASLFRALEEGRIAESLLDEEIEAGHARPSLRYQIEAGISDPLLIPRRIRDRLDADFLSRNNKLRNRAAGPALTLKSLRLQLLAQSRQIFYRTGVATKVETALPRVNSARRASSIC